MSAKTAIQASRFEKSTVAPPRLPRAFWSLWLGEAVSSLGGAIGTVANSWILYEWTGSKTAMGSLWLIYFLPSLLLQLGIGPYLDRWNRQRVMVFAQLARGLVFLVPTLMLAGGLHEVWPLYVVQAVIGLVQPLYVPSSLALMPSLVPPDQLLRANARLDGVTRLMSFLGPPVGGLLVEVLGVSGSLLGVSMLFLLSCGLLLTIQEPPRDRAQERPAWGRQIRSGHRFFWQQRLLVWLAVLMSFVQFGVGVTMVLNLPYVTDELGGDSFWYGVFLAGFPLGYVFGTLFVGRIRALRWAMLGSLFLGGLTFVMLGFVHHLWLAVLVEVLAGVAAPFFSVPNTSLFQQRTPKEMLGSVLSVRLLILRGAMPLGNLVGSQLGEAWGVRPMLWVIGSLICLAALLACTSPLLRTVALADQKTPA